MNCPKCKKESQVTDAMFCPFCATKLETTERTQNSKSRGNGQGSVYKTDTGWVACVVKYYYTDDQGNRKPRRVKKTGFRTKKEAVAHLSILSGKSEKKIPALNDYWRLWENANLPKLSDSKQTAYAIAKKKLEDIFYTPVDQLTIEDLQTAVDNKAPTYYPAKDMKTVLSHLYDRAVAQNDVKTNLASYIVLPDLIEGEQQPFSKDEQNALWKLFAKGDEFAPYILLMIYTGMMPGEVMTIRKEMVDWGNQQILGGGKKTKKRKETPIILPDIIIPVIEKIFDISKGDKLLHINKDNFYKQFYACLESAGCRKLPPYSCRHTTGTALGTSDIPVAIGKEIMRQAKITSFQRYVHVDSSTMLEAANKAQTSKQKKEDHEVL